MNRSEQAPFVHVDTEFARRYDVIEAANEQSFYVTGQGRDFDVFISAHTNGGERDEFGRAAERVLLAGSMSAKFGPLEMTDEERIHNAAANSLQFFEDANIAPGNVRILYSGKNPMDPLSLVDIDAQKVPEENVHPVTLSKDGDFIFTYNQELALAARPADCPLMLASAETPKGQIHFLVHYPWRGAATGYVEQTGELFDELQIDRSTVRMYLTPGGQAESFPFEKYPQDPRQEFPGSEGLFVNVREKDDGWYFDIDTPNFVYQEVLKLGIDPKQVYCDTSDTSNLNSGYSSHGRSMRLNEQNSRDMAVIKFQTIAQNPEKIAPPEIFDAIVPVHVGYIDMDGNQQQATFEIHEDARDDVIAFFRKAEELGFPIESIARSSDHGWDDEILMDQNISSGFNYRLIKGTDKPSLHGRGLAFDINPRINPYLRFVEGEVEVNPGGAVYDPSAPGALYADHPLVTFMKERGWEWGGDWTEELGVIDYQHFQKKPSA